MLFFQTQVWLNSIFHLSGLMIGFDEISHKNLSFAQRFVVYCPIEIRETPNAAEIFANVASVKLCPPPTQCDTAASDVPTIFANSFCDNPRLRSRLSIQSAISYDHSTCNFKAFGVLSSVCWKSCSVSLECFIYQILCRPRQRGRPPQW